MSLHLLRYMLLLLCITACSEMKSAGKTVGHTTRDVTREIGHGTREVVTDIGHGTRDAVNGVKDGWNEADSK
jgi:hypothetical protein